MPELMISIPLARLKPSPLNPRKHLGDPAKLAELAASMKEHGVLEPVIARQSKRGETYELVCGHRRLAAAKEAKLDGVPAIVRELTDDQVLDIQIIENSQREDVHPLDEARAFAHALERGRTVSDIADKIGRPSSFVTQRLQLCQLTAKAAAALDEGALSLGGALVLARVPGKLQDDALKEVLSDAGPDVTLTTKAVGELVRDKYMLKLADAAFDRADAKLLAKAGACTVCPKRTGNQTELFDDVKSPDICTDPACFREKNGAHFQQIAASAKATGVKILSNAVAKKTFHKWGSNGGIASSEYERLDGERSHYGAGGSKRFKVKTLVGPDAEITIGQNPHTGEVVKLVSKKVVEAALRKATKQKADKSGSSKKRKPSAKAQAKQDEAAQKAEAKEQVNEALAGAVAEEVERRAPELPREAIRLVLLAVADAGEGFQEMCARRQIGPELRKKNGGFIPGAWMKVRKAFEAQAAKADSEWLWGVMIEIVARDLMARDYGPKTGHVDPLLKAFGVDRKKVERETLAALAAAKKAEAAADPPPKKKAAAKKATAKKKGRG